MLNSTKDRRGLRYLLPLVCASAFVVGTVACATTVDDGAQQKREITAKELRARAGQGHRGYVGVVLDTVRARGNLSAEQAVRLAAIEADLKDDLGGRRELGDKLRASAVAVVRSGSADSNDFDQSVALATGAIAERMQRSVDALDEVHAVLLTDQRKAVAVALRARIDEKFGAKRDDAQYKHDGFGRLAKKLVLSRLQIDKLQAMKKELIGEKQQLRPSREELDQLVDAFEGEDFSARLESFRAKKAKILRARIAEAGERTDSVLGVLSTEQRDVLADLIEGGLYQVLLGHKPAEKSAD
ncbi:MAG: hypothetical protein IPI67_37735 [Myxococcales bacterium]|nr:hypothetical protein [Myxococcales bacterium]